MPATGYSGTPLLKKLGIKPGLKILLLNEPDNYFELLESDISDQLCNENETPDLIHLFVKNNKEFETTMKKLEPFCKKIQPLLFGYRGIKKLPFASSTSSELRVNYQLILRKTPSAIMHCGMEW